MTTEDTTAPDPLAAARAALDAAIVAAEAATALNGVNCLYVELFAPQVEQRLRREPGGEVVVTDADGAVRRGISPAHLAREIRDEWQKKQRDKYFAR